MSKNESENGDEYTAGTERHQPCEECGEPVDTEEPGCWKATNDEQWWHNECFDKLAEFEEVRKRLYHLIAPEGLDDGLSADFHDALDNIQAELGDEIKRERVRQDQGVA